MPFRPPNFSPVLPLSTGSALSKSLAEILQRFGVRKDREKQQNQELSAALELQNLKHRNQIALKQIESKFRAGEDVAQFERGAPERAFKQTEFESDVEQKRLERTSREGQAEKNRQNQLRIAKIRADRTTDRAKSNSLGGRTIAQLVDDLRATSKVAVRDKEGKLTGKREFTTPEHEQQFNFTKDMLELEKAGLNDVDLEQAGMSPDDAIALKKRFIFPTLDKTGKRVMQKKLTKPEIVKLIRAGVNLEMIDNAMNTLRQRPEYARHTNEMLIRLIIKSIE